MTGDGRRWELGSDLEMTLEAGAADLPWTRHPHSLWGSGRDAIRALFEWGAREHGWRRLLMPSYFCQEVVASAQRSADVRVYSWSPLDEVHEPVATQDGDVVFIDAMYGARPDVEVPGPAMVIEDHSHDLLAPWAIDSTADYAIASLRKTLPLPDGGVIWSPQGRQGPPERTMTSTHAETVLQRLSAMALKTTYLRHGVVSKDAYRSLALQGEETMASGDITGISPFSRARLPSLPVDEWRLARAANLQVLRDRLAGAPGIRMLDVPFAATILFDDEELRPSVRRGLLDHDIYPSVLWPLDKPVVAGIPDAHVEVSRRMLSIHCDQRYAASDMVRVADTVRAILDGR